MNPHRVGFPYAPLPLPNQNEAVFESNDPLFNKQVDDHHSQIIRVLDSSNISWRDIIPSLQWRNLDGSNKRRVLTIPIMEELERPRALETAQIIHNLLNSTRDLDVQVQITDSKGFDFREITDQLPSDEDQKSYDIIEPSLLHTLDRQLPSSWLDFGLFLCNDPAPNGKTKSPLIIIFVQEHSTADWDTVATEITRALKGRFDWRFQPGCHIPLSPLRTADGSREDGEFSSQVDSGSSITCAANPSSQGTVGIFVDLEVPTESASIYGMSPGIHKAVIACHHCIAPVDGSPADPGPMYKKGLPFSSDHNAARSVSYPGKLDRSTSTAYLDLRIKQLTKEIEERKNLRRSSWSYDEESKITRKIRYCESEKVRMEETLARCQALFRSGSIGIVLVSSGIYVSDYGCNLMTRALLPPSDGIVAATFDDSCPCNHGHHLHDFAVISLNKDIRAINVAPRQDRGLRPVEAIDRTGSPKVGSVVYKLGGASDGTQGRIKDYKLVNRSVDFPISSLINGESVHSTLIRFYAWRIISQGHSSPFSKPGDSSAGINDEEERLIGQLHSGFYNGASVPVTYMNAIDDVFRDVEEAMPGLHIRLSIPEPSLLKSIARGLERFRGRWWREPEPEPEYGSD